MNDFEMPKLKVKLSKFEIDDLRKQKKTKKIVIFSVLVILLVVGGLIFGIASLKK